MPDEVKLQLAADLKHHVDLLNAHYASLAGPDEHCSTHALLDALAFRALCIQTTTQLLIKATDG